MQNNKLMAILSYLGIVVAVPLFMGKESKFARFHNNQGLILLLLEVAYGTLRSIIVNVLRAIFVNVYALWNVYWLYNTIVIILNVLWLAFVAFSVIGIVNAAQGKKQPLPLIGKFDILK
ncbi:MAG: hypothetical protein AB7V55_07825 [Oscillospiraceae bacterium]